MKLTMEEAFWAKVSRGAPDACWEWQAATLAGYGQFRRPSVPGSPLAHRVSWVLHNGPIPEGMSVLHRCDNRPCVNPAHLFLGTHDDNMRDMRAKERGARGMRHGRRKLTEEQVREMRALYAAGNVAVEQLGARFGVNKAQAHRIVSRQNWRHL